MTTAQATYRIISNLWLITAAAIVVVPGSNWAPFGAAIFIATTNQWLERQEEKRKVGPVIPLNRP
jgi:hypothetical protein